MVTEPGASAGPTNLIFLLGGQDLEMQTIRALLQQHGQAFQDKGLGWGARASAYRQEIAEAVGAGKVPVLVELAPDVPLPVAAVLVDHHDERAGIGQPSSLRQVFDLLGLPDSAWTQRLALIEANDVGHVSAMAAIGASRDEMIAIRSADRAAQGVTAEDEQQAREAVAARRDLADGGLTVVELSHRRAGVVADLLTRELGGPGADRLLVLMPDETAFFGDGATVEWLAAGWPGGWRGGELPRRGYWGIAKRLPDILPALENRLKETAP